MQEAKVTGNVEGLKSDGGVRDGHGSGSSQSVVSITSRLRGSIATWEFALGFVSVLFCFQVSLASVQRTN